MATAKVSLTLDEATLAAARERVGRRGLSGYVNRALELQLQRDRVGAFLDEMAAETGPIDPRVMAEVREAWPDPASDESRRRAG